MRTKEQNRRYYLHQKLKKQGYSVNTNEHTCYINHAQPPVKEMIELRDKFNYSIQTEI
jgi:hypothetical protein